MIGPRRIAAGLSRRASYLIRGRPVEPALLEMIWPRSPAPGAPDVNVAPGYLLRQFRQGDLAAYQALLTAADMSQCRLDYWEQHLLPDGFFVIEHEASGALVATCMASHHPAPRHPRAGNLGWLAADPAHRGAGLGRAAAAAVTARLVRGGYRRLYLETHDHRLAAIRIYLQQGWVPLLYQEDMHDRWKAVCNQINWPFTPDDWRR